MKLLSFRVPHPHNSGMEFCYTAAGHEVSCADTCDGMETSPVDGTDQLASQPGRCFQLMWDRLWSDAEKINILILLFSPISNLIFQVSNFYKFFFTRLWYLQPPHCDQL
jgi:hypothetical protein